jgi:hypothetical protein
MSTANSSQKRLVSGDGAVEFTLVERFVGIELSVPNLLHNASRSLAREFSREELTIRNFEKHYLRPAWCRSSNFHN